MQISTLIATLTCSFFSLFFMVYLTLQKAFAGVGIEIAANELPFQTCHIEFLSNQGLNDSTCSATLISPLFILSAGHCFEKVDINKTKHVVRCPNGQSSQISQIQFAAEFKTNEIMKADESARRHDAALLHLEKPIDLPGMRIVTTKKGLVDLVEASAECGLFGYGGVDPLDKKYGQLRGVKVNPLDVSIGHAEPIYTHNIGGWNSGLVLPGDSGGTLACLDQNKEWVLIGITSAMSYHYTSLFAPLFYNRDLLTSEFIPETETAQTNAQVLRLELLAARIEKEISSIEKALEGKVAEVAETFRRRLAEVKGFAEGKALLREIRATQIELLQQFVGVRAKFHPFSHVYLDFSEPNNIQVDGPIGRDHLTEDKNPMSIVDSYFHLFTIAKIDQDVAIGDLIIFGSSEVFICRENVLCAPGNYKNVRVSLKQIDFATIRR